MTKRKKTSSPKSKKTKSVKRRKEVDNSNDNNKHTTDIIDEELVTMSYLEELWSEVPTDDLGIQDLLRKMKLMTSFMNNRIPSRSERNILVQLMGLYIYQLMQTSSELIAKPKKAFSWGKKFAKWLEKYPIEWKVAICKHLLEFPDGEWIYFMFLEGMFSIRKLDVFGDEAVVTFFQFMDNNDNTVSLWIRSILLVIQKSFKDAHSDTPNHEITRKICLKLPNIILWLENIAAITFNKRAASSLIEFVSARTADNAEFNNIQLRFFTAFYDLPEMVSKGPQEIVGDLFETILNGNEKMTSLTPIARDDLSVIEKLDIWIKRLVGAGYRDEIIKKALTRNEYAIIKNMAETDIDRDIVEEFDLYVAKKGFDHEPLVAEDDALDNLFQNVDKLCQNLQDEYGIEELRAIGSKYRVPQDILDGASKSELCASITLGILKKRTELNKRRQ